MHSGLNLVKDGLVFGYDNGYGFTNSNNSTTYYKGSPTVNLVSDPATMSGWSSYDAGNDGTFMTEFGTVGYRINRRNTWNGLVKGVGLPSPGTYTISAWFRIRGKSSGNNGINVYTSGGGIGDTAEGGNDGLFGEWQRISMTRTYTTTSFNFYIISWGGTRGVDWSSWDVTMPQVEAGSAVTPFTDGTRSSTQALIDTKRTTTLDLANVSFDSNRLPYFDGTNDKIAGNWPGSLNVDDNTTPRTWEVIVKPTSTTSWHGVWGHKAGAGCSYYCNGGIYIREGYYYFVWYDNAAYRWVNSGVAATANQYAHVVGTFESDANPRIYVNGVYKAAWGSATQLNYSSGMVVYDIGFNSDNGGQHYFPGEIPAARFYKNKALSATEVYNNYLAYKGRFNLS